MGRFFFTFFYEEKYHNYQLYLDFAHNAHKILPGLFDFP